MLAFHPESQVPFEKLNFPGVTMKWSAHANQLVQQFATMSASLHASSTGSVFCFRCSALAVR